VGWKIWGTIGKSSRGGEKKGVPNSDPFYVKRGLKQNLKAEGEGKFGQNAFKKEPKGEIKRQGCLGCSDQKKKNKNAREGRPYAAEKKKKNFENRKKEGKSNILAGKKEKEGGKENSGKKQKKSDLVQGADLVGGGQEKRRKEGGEGKYRLGRKVRQGVGAETHGDGEGKTTRAKFLKYAKGSSQWGLGTCTT